MARTHRRSTYKTGVWSLTPHTKKSSFFFREKNQNQLKSQNHKFKYGEIKNESAQAKDHPSQIRENSEASCEKHDWKTNLEHCILPDSFRVLFFFKCSEGT